MKIFKHFLQTSPAWDLSESYINRNAIPTSSSLEEREKTRKAKLDKNQCLKNLTKNNIMLAYISGDTAAARIS